MENCISREIFSMLEEAKNISAANPKKSYEISRKAYNLAKCNNLRQEEGYALIGMSLAFRAMSELNKWLDYSYNALEIFDELNDINGQIRALNLIGIAYFYNSIYEEALKHLLRAMNLLENHDNKFLSSCVLNNIGEVYRESGRNDKALKYYEMAMTISKDLNLKLNIAALLNNIGKVHFEQGKYEDALNSYMESYNTLINEKDEISLGEVEDLIGRIYFIKKDYIRSMEYYFSALRRLENIENKFYTIDVLINIGQLKLEQNAKEAFVYFEKAIQYAEEIDSRKKLSILFKILADYYERAGSYGYALEYFKKFHSIEQEMAVTLISNKLEILQIELKHLRSDEKIEEIKMINERLESEIVNHRMELENIKRMNKKLEKKVLEDELTKVPNRRYITTRLIKTFEDHSSGDKTITLFIIDIDNFKRYNDFWGHSKGDECLVKIAECLDNVGRIRKDTFGRYGGEEFVYFVLGLDYNKSIELGNQLKDEIEKLKIKYTPEENSKTVTISIGGAFGKVSGFKNTAEILEIADKQLYISKEMGRNIVHINSML